MIKLIIAALITVSAGPALAFMSLKSCNITPTMNGLKYMGEYCNMQGQCITVLFDHYCPPML